MYKPQQLVERGVFVFAPCQINTPPPRHVAVVWRYSEMLNHTILVVQHLWFKELRGEVWQYSSRLMCFLNGHLLGNERDLASWAKKQWGFTFTRPQAFYKALTEDCYSKHLQKTGASQQHFHINTIHVFKTKNQEECLWLLYSFCSNQFRTWLDYLLVAFLGIGSFSSSWNILRHEHEK